VTAVAIVLGSLLLWLAIACPFAVLTGRVIKTDEPDLLADQPAEILSAAEVDRRFAAITAGDRVWWA
jgi:hypothetical protein